MFDRACTDMRSVVFTPHFNFIHPKIDIFANGKFFPNFFACLKPQQGGTMSA